MPVILGQKRGYFISFEGVDGAGKGNQIDLLRQSLQKIGFKVSVFRCPGSTKIGEVVRELAKDPANKNMAPQTELLLMNATTAQLVNEKIIPALAEGQVVLCDRFYHSTIVYQAFGRQIDNIIVKAMIQYAVGDTVPDITFMLDVSEEEAAKRAKGRGTTDRFEQEEQAFQNRVRQGYDWLKGLEPISNGKVITIEASGTREATHTEIFRCAASRLSTLKEGQLEMDNGKKIIV